MRSFVANETCRTKVAGGVGVGVGVGEVAAVGVGIGSGEGISELWTMINWPPDVRKARPLLPQRIILLMSPFTPLTVIVPISTNVLMSKTLIVLTELFEKSFIR